MRLFPWLRQRIDARGGKELSRKHRRAPRFRPRLEALEDRCVPSTLTVDHTWDNSAPPGTPAPQGTLEWAAGVAQNGDTIVITGDAVNHGIDLRHGEIVLTQQNLTIQTAANKSPATISGDNLSRVFEVASGANVTLADVNITGGNGVANNTATGAGDGEGGGIVVDPGATLTLSGSTLSNNFGNREGGGIASFGTLTVSGSTISGNSAGEFAGGIFNGGTLMLNGSSVSGNSSEEGGAILTDTYATATVSGSTLSGNSAGFGCGGGIINFGTLTVTGSIVSGNSSEDGGGIENGGTLTVSGSSLSGNSAGYGGGIFNFGVGTMLTVTNTTLSGNSVIAGGGGLWNGTGAVATISGGTVSGNSADDGGGIWNGSGSMLTLTNATLSGNSAFGDGGGLWNGFSSVVTVSGGTVSGNSAAHEGGGILNSGTLYVIDASTVCGNTAPAGADLYNLGVVFISKDSDVCVIGP